MPGPAFSASPPPPSSAPSPRARAGPLPPRRRSRRRSWMAGRAVAALLAPAGAREAYHGHMPLRLQGLSEQYESSCQRKDGTRFWAEITASPFRDAEGHIVGTLAAVMDVSDRKKIQEELV